MLRMRASHSRSLLKREIIINLTNTSANQAGQQNKPQYKKVLKCTYRSWEATNSP